MQSVSSKIWTRVAVSISYDDNHYTTATAWKWRLYQIVIGVLCTIIEGLIKGLEDLEIRGRDETLQTTVLLRSAKVLRRFMETWGDLLSPKFQWKTIN